MEQIKSQVEFIQALYLHKKTRNSIVERAEFWTNEDVYIRFWQRLTGSALAQRLVRNLVHWSWDAAPILGDHTQRSAVLLLQNLGAPSSEELPGYPDMYVRHWSSHTLDLNALKFATRNLSKIIDAIFEDLFLELPWPETKDTMQDITQHLRLIDGKLEEQFYWLGQTLDDLGHVMPPGEMSLEDKPAQTRQAG